MPAEFPDHLPFMAFAEHLADTSRGLLLEAANHLPEVTLKPDASYVTATDRAIEQVLRARILERFPEHGIMGEELGNHRLEADFVWVLDPIDGTAPFIAGLPVYGTLIGLAWQGRPFLGVIDQAATATRWVGVSGRFAQCNGQAVTVRACSALENAFVTCSNPDFMNPPAQARFQCIREKAQYIQYGGSCYAYGVLASGRTDLAIDSGLDPVDVYACAAVIEGAGGVMTDWQGQPLSFDMDKNVIAAGDRARLEEAITLLQTAPE